MPSLPPGLPVWAYVLFALFVIIFGGGGLIIWNFRKELRDSRLAPAHEAAAELENQKATNEIANMLREAQRAAVADMKNLLIEASARAAVAADEARTARHEATEARKEAAEARAESTELRRRLDTTEATYATFRRRIADWMQQQGYALPDWWHTQP